MKVSPKTIPIERYIAIDSHKHYVMVGGMNAAREWTLRPRKLAVLGFVLVYAHIYTGKRGRERLGEFD